MRTEMDGTKARPGTDRNSSGHRTGSDKRRFHWRSFFLGRNGLRTGWRLFVFLAIFLSLAYIVSRAIDPLLRSLHVDMATPLGITISFGLFVPALLLASLIMAGIEGRTLADYGLPWRQAFGRRFWLGAAISFASLTTLLLGIRLAGGCSFGPLTLHGTVIWKYAAAWSVPVFLAALLEDFFYRGYLLFTLADGIGFWPAATLTSLLMGGAHYFNPGGHGLGPIAAIMYCLVTALLLRRTGDLWMPLGIHSAWSWGEIFFYGVPSSGFPATGHLFQVSLHGSDLLTGGAFGPEASVLNFVLLAAWWLIFSVTLRKKPNTRASESARPVC
jgi:uncharacterized protein